MREERQECSKLSEKAAKAFTSGKRSLQDLAGNSGFYLPPTPPPRQPLPPHPGQAAAAPARSGPLLPRRSPWAAGAVGSSGTYSSQLYRGRRVWAALGCWVPARVTIKRSLVSASFLGTKSVLLKGKREAKLVANTAPNLVEKG